MLDHKITLDSKYCHLRPLVDNDEAAVIALWNQDYVVGRLFMTKTSVETYRMFFDKYKNDANEFRFAVEDSNRTFVGTVGFERINQQVCRIGLLALHHTKDPVAVAMQLLLLDFLFSDMKFGEIVFTVHASNLKIKKFHLAFGAVDTGTRVEKMGSNREVIVLENWKYVAKNWPGIREQFANILN